MTKPPVSSRRRAPLAPRRARSWLSFVALCSVLLQLVSALHFSLVKHRFNAELGSFAHEHVLLAQRAVAAPAAPSEHPQLVGGTAVCAPEVCPVGFAGPVSALLVAAGLQQLIALPVVTSSLSQRHALVGRARCLLSAPKTSPPGQA